MDLINSELGRPWTEVYSELTCGRFGGCLTRQSLAGRLSLRLQAAACSGSPGCWSPTQCMPITCTTPPPAPPLRAGRSPLPPPAWARCTRARCGPRARRWPSRSSAPGERRRQRRSGRVPRPSSVGSDGWPAHRPPSALHAAFHSQPPGVPGAHLNLTLLCSAAPQRPGDGDRGPVHHPQPGPGPAPLPLHHPPRRRRVAAGRVGRPLLRGAPGGGRRMQRRAAKAVEGAASGGARASRAL